MTWAYFTLIFLTMVTSVCGAVGNSVVIWLLSCRSQHTPFTVYMLNLAVADLLFLLCMAAVLSLETQPHPELDSISNDATPDFTPYAIAYEAMWRVKYFAYTTGLSLLTAISTQRCLSVLCPIWYKCHQPQHLSTIVTALLWALSFSMNMLASYFCTTYLHFHKQHCFKVDMAIGTLILGVFMPVMAISSAILFVQVRKSIVQRPRRLYVVILTTVFVFLVCSLPLGIYWYVVLWTDPKPQVKLLWLCVSRFSSSVSSSANPVIYFLVGNQRHRKLKESMGAILNRALQEEPELEGRETPSTGIQERI